METQNAAGVKMEVVAVLNSAYLPCHPATKWRSIRESNKLVLNKKVCRLLVAFIELESELKLENRSENLL